MKVGLMLPQSAADGAGTWREIADLARQAESGGADSLWLCDHFFYRREDGTEVGIAEAWTLLSALAAVTERVELGTLVLATSYRPAGLLAKMAAALDDVAAGRLILGLGCGWYEPEYRAFGYPFDHRVARFEEAITVIRRLLEGERVTFTSRWTQLEDAAVSPPPARSIRLLVAAERERMLRVTARHADLWQTAWYGLPDDRWAARLDAFRTACDAEGREPATLPIFVGVSVGEEDDHRPGWRPITLDPAAVADALGTWSAEGVAHVELGIAGRAPETFGVLLDGIARFRAAG